MTKPRKININTLSAQELDELILRAAKRRAELAILIPTEVPKVEWHVVDPNYFTYPTTDGCMLQLRHPGYGWVAYMLPHKERATLLQYLINQITANLTS